jgi:hypothetical protein
MAEKKLARSVRVRDDEGTDHVFSPGDDVPSWAQSKITNPGAWVDDDARPVIDRPVGPGEASKAPRAPHAEHDDEDGEQTGSPRPSSSRRKQ